MSTTRAAASPARPTPWSPGPRCSRLPAGGARHGEFEPFLPLRGTKEIHQVRRRGTGNATVLTTILTTIW